MVYSKESQGRSFTTCACCDALCCFVLSVPPPPPHKKLYLCRSGMGKSAKILCTRMECPSTTHHGNMLSMWCPHPCWRRRQGRAGVGGCQTECHTGGGGGGLPTARTVHCTILVVARVPGQEK